MMTAAATNEEAGTLRGAGRACSGAASPGRHAWTWRRRCASAGVSRGLDTTDRRSAVSHLGKPWNTSEGRATHCRRTDYNTSEHRPRLPADAQSAALDTNVLW